jgi:hypothetical protein
MKTIGKNFSGNNVTGNRKKSDTYETPYSMTQQLLDAHPIPKDSLIVEPACGNYAIIEVLNKNGYKFPCFYDLAQGKDFLEETRSFDIVLTNPPFSLAYEFIMKAKQIAQESIIMLLPLSYLHGKSRHDNIWTDKEFPLRYVYVFTRYPMLGDPLREDGKYKTGMMVYAWYVWEKSKYVNEPVIRWIDNHKYVIGSRSKG